MITIDLITGFLGSGKTTFIKEYIKYLKLHNERICIVENDYGAINIDLMIIKNLGVDCEMIQGGSDYNTHYRRFKTRLISLMNKGYTRIIVEPSGIYDTAEFFDVLYEEPLINSYQIGNIFCMYDINTKTLSKESEYIFVEEASKASKLIISKRDNKKLEVNLDYINELMKKYNCNRIFNLKDIIYNDNLNFNELINSGYKSYDLIKYQVMNSNKYDSIYLLDKDYNKENIIKLKDELFQNKYGNIIRLKGFIYQDNKWYLVNVTKDEFVVEEVKEGQKVLIIIGENINKEKIDKIIK